MTTARILPPTGIPARSVTATAAVFYRDGRVFRTLSARAFANWQRLQDGAVLRPAPGRRPHRRHLDGGAPRPSGGAGVLEHARIPFVSYPYEWTFGMLRDAALLHLELMRDALAAGMILKDASPYNIQWNGVRPVFIDIPSFEPLRRGEPWVGYRQFCELFLYPLMLQAYKGIDFRPWLRGRIDGIPAEEMQPADVGARPAAPRRADARRRAERAAAALRRQRTRRARRAGRGRLRQGADRAQRGQARRAWSRGSSRGGAKTDVGRLRSDAFLRRGGVRAEGRVRRAPPRRRGAGGWPGISAATPAPSRASSAAHADHVVAMDGDWMAIEHLYQREKAGEPSASILPLVVNLADASPNQGWRGAERKGLAERGRPELTLCLALVHHIVISANIPLADFIGWLADLGTAVVIEFVGRDDEMVQTLLANREDQYSDYHPEVFRDAAGGPLRHQAEQPLKGGKRHIYFAEARPGYAGGLA